MKIVRFKAAGKTRYGVLDGTHIVEYSGTPYGTFKKARKRYALKQAVLLAPVVPSKIVAVGLNYRDHAEEMHLAVPDEPRSSSSRCRRSAGRTTRSSTRPSRTGWTTRASSPS